MLESMQTTLVTCPTVREKDGLAMSSRNMRLTHEQRAIAPIIYQALEQIKKNLVPGNLVHLKQQAIHMLTSAGFKVEYVEIADAVTLQPYNEWDGYTSIVILAAAFLGNVRLIDNMLVNN
jgi:pantoate--beta-alanine ligase